jgi:hypothetical protein
VTEGFSVFDNSNDPQTHHKTSSTERFHMLTKFTVDKQMSSTSLVRQQFIVSPVNIFLIRIGSAELQALLPPGASTGTRFRMDSPKLH